MHVMVFVIFLICWLLFFGLLVKVSMHGQGPLSAPSGPSHRCPAQANHCVSGAAQTRMERGEEGRIPGTPPPPPSPPTPPPVSSNLLPVSGLGVCFLRDREVCTKSFFGEKRGKQKKCPTYSECMSSIAVPPFRK
jgi:hypothetical protein